MLHQFGLAAARTTDQVSVLSLSVLHPDRVGAVEYLPQGFVLSFHQFKIAFEAFGITVDEPVPSVHVCDAQQFVNRVQHPQFIEILHRRPVPEHLVKLRKADEPYVFEQQFDKSPKREKPLCPFAEPYEPKPEKFIYAVGHVLQLCSPQKDTVVLVQDWRPCRIDKFFQLVVEHPAIHHQTLS